MQENKIIPRGYPDRESFGAIAEIAIMLKAAGVGYRMIIKPDDDRSFAPKHPFYSSLVMIRTLGYEATVYAWAECHGGLTAFDLENREMISVARYDGCTLADAKEHDSPSEAAEYMMDGGSPTRHGRPPWKK